MNSFPDSSVLFNAIKDPAYAGGVRYIDPKGDHSLATSIHDIYARSRIFVREARRRGVRFLPSQVLRLLFVKAGLSVGSFYKHVREDDVYLSAPSTTRQV
ncbi:hypothetical protein ABIC83_003074 [Roseateles asaccharophilus]|uniref:hypothetical protein n=1 Tax=Roseateles asaccharophilus TaxID=582607 RepID=UPI0038353535